MEPRIAKYDEMLASFVSLSGSWNEERQTHIQAGATNQWIADVKFDDLYAKAHSSISEVNG